MKIAVIGSGISGLGAAHFLSKKHNVDLFEKNDHFGGHSYTVDISLNKFIMQPYPCIHQQKDKNRKDFYLHKHCLP